VREVTPRAGSAVAVNFGRAKELIIMAEHLFRVDQLHGAHIGVERAMIVAMTILAKMAAPR
jgi:hypothetical protein